MPARKSNASVASTDHNDAANGLTPAELAAKQQEQEGLSVEDLSLPKTMIQRLAKGVLPPNTQIQKDALLAISKSATVFVNYLAAYAYDTAERANHRVIQGPDVLAALDELEFGAFLTRVEGEMTKYQEIKCGKRNNYRKNRKEQERAAQGPGPNGDGDGEEPTAGATQGEGEGKGKGDGGRPVKKVRKADGHGEEAEEEDAEETEEEGGEVEDEEEVEHDEVEEDEDEPAEGGDDLMEDDEEDMDRTQEEDDVLDDAEDSDGI